MKSLRMWQVDAFTQEVFAGNPAAVVLLEKPLPDATLQAIAAENNVSETAFLVAQGHDYGIRWFTPTVEVDLCGHATLAAGYVVFEHLEPTRGSVVFHSRSGPLTVHHDQRQQRGHARERERDPRPPWHAVPEPSSVVASHATT
ncbi:MAG: PhzF family phenazine biosynthesis protein, partial [bacterium]